MRDGIQDTQDDLGAATEHAEKTFARAAALMAESEARKQTKATFRLTQAQRDAIYEWLDRCIDYPNDSTTDMAAESLITAIEGANP